MVNCVVSGCPNRMVSVHHHHTTHRPPKRFFSFPREPSRVKVWLAALRETNKQDTTEQHFICEDHFLPEDISSSGVKKDAIPIMPPYLDGPAGLSSPWAAESSEEEEEQWATSACGGGGDEEYGDEGGDVPAANHLQQGPGPGLENPQTETSAAALQMECSTTVKKASRRDVSLGLLTRSFLELLVAAPDGSLDLGQVTTALRTRRRRVYDITNVLTGISLIRKESASRIKWIGTSQISDFLKSQQRLQREQENLKMVEDTLDSLIKSCAQQLFDMTDDTENSASAYVTHDDISRLTVLQEQTVIVVKAPEETKLEIPAPKEDRIQVHLKAAKGPIMVLTCEVGSSDPLQVTSEAGQTGSGFFLTLEQSRVTTTTLHSEC